MTIMRMTTMTMTENDRVTILPNKFNTKKIARKSWKTAKKAINCSKYRIQNFLNILK